MRFRSRTPPGARKQVWRITPGAPEGEWVDPTTVPPPKVDVPERDSTTWAMSSFDLQYGADITEFSDTLPSDLHDELFPPRSGLPKRSVK
jgi:hypothetical protein